MGKQWHGGKSHKSSSNNDLTSCRGLSIVIATCDAARERETSKELVNLFSQTIEDLKEASAGDDNNIDDNNNNQTSSIQDMLQQELNEIRGRTNKNVQNVMSINTGVKGIVCIKFLNTQYTSYNIIKYIFDKIKDTKESLSRYAIRVVPLEHVFFPNIEELNTHILKLFPDHIPLPIPPVAPLSSIRDSEAETEIISENDKIITTNDEVKDESSVLGKRDHSSIPSEESITSILQPVTKASRIETTSSTTAAPSSSSASHKVSETTHSVDTSTTHPSSSTTPAADPNYASYSYTIIFKARNHNTLTRPDVIAALDPLVPPGSKYCVTTKCQVCVRALYS